MIVQSKVQTQLTMFRTTGLVCLGLALLTAGATAVQADEEKQAAENESQPAENEPRTSENDPELKADLEKLQGKWELYHGNELKGPPNTRSVKIIDGNTETMQRYNLQGNLVREWQVEFILQKDGDLKIFTFYPVGGKPGQGASFLYRIQGDRFYDVPGMFTGEKYRNYLREPAFWIWHRVKKEDAEKEKQTALTPPLLNMISVMPGDHIFVGHRHNNKYRHLKLDELKSHLEKYQPKQVTLAVDQKADAEFAKQVIELCKTSGVDQLDVKDSSDDPLLKPKAKPGAKPRRFIEVF